jgi:hypothetical protein
MTKRFKFFALLLCVFTMPALAGNPSGTWSGQITDPGGNDHPIVLVIEADGSKITGSLTGGPPMGAKQTIENGVLNGDEISFDIKAPGPNGDFVMFYKGKISGNHIEGTNTSPMGGLPWGVTRK